MMQSTFVFISFASKCIIFLLLLDAYIKHCIQLYIFAFSLDAW